MEQNIEDNKIYNDESFIKWKNTWRKRIKLNNKPLNEVIDLMRSVNPLVIPRNHKVEEVLNSANSNNYFFYLNPETDKFHFLPWGADSLFEKFSQLGDDPQAPISVKTQGLIAQRLYQIKSCRKRYAKTLKGILDKHWKEEELLAETARLEVLLKPHLIPSQERAMRGQQGILNQILGRWEKGENKHPTSLSSIRNFIRNRRSEIINEIANGMPVR